MTEIIQCNLSTAHREVMLVVDYTPDQYVTGWSEQQEAQRRCDMLATADTSSDHTYYCHEVKTEWS